MRRFAKSTYLALARCCSRVLLELDVLICAGLISFAPSWPATGQQNSVSSSYIFECELMGQAAWRERTHLTGQSSRGATGDHRAAYGWSIRNGVNQRCWWSSG